MVITGCDVQDQCSRDLYEKRPCITSPVDYLGVPHSNES